ncbi:MAG: hypothetical protein WC789_07150 [Lentisphaeria bacterium]
MRLHLETTEAELRVKAPELLHQLADALEGVTPELAKALEQVADSQQAEQTGGGGRPGERALDQLLEQAHQVYARRVQQMLEAISRVVSRDYLLAVQKSDPWVEVDEQVGARLWLALGMPDGEDPLEKAGAGIEGAPKAGHKYIRRVPYTGKDGKRHYRYFYHEAALGRQAQAGETIRMGDRRSLQVVEVDREGRVTFEDEGEARIGDREETVVRTAPGAPTGKEDKGTPQKRRRTVSADEWVEVLGQHFGQEVVDKAVERRALMAVKAVTRHVPAELLQDLQGETDEERMADLQRRVPDVYERLQKAFKRAGVDPWRAKLVVSRSLQRHGWEDAARAAAIGSVLTPEGAQLAKRHVQLLDAAENLAGGRKVRARHVQTAADLMQGMPEKFEAAVRKTAERAEAELLRLHQLLEAARAAPAGEPGEPVGRLLQTAMQSPAVQELLKLAQAFPGLQDRAIPVAQQIIPQVVAEAPRVEPKTEGGPTHVFVAGEGGRPRALQARYKLVEAHDLQASHLPGAGFKQNEAYPQGVQERVYHRDKAEQLKVLRNAQQLNPAFICNTNPDAVNGPPLVTAGGIVLGGNSRTMSMQRAYAEHPEKAKELQKFLAEHAHEFGFKPEDVQALRNPVLVRVVSTPDERPETLRLLVRQFNESFTQGMDPRTMQVALGRKVDDRTIEDMAASMREDESLGDFLSSSRAEAFVAALYRTGVIDDRNSNQFVRKGTKHLNEDGKQLVSRMLVGRLVGDADLMAEIRPKALDSVANATPFMLMAAQAGKKYDLGPSLRTALDALNVLQNRVDEGTIKPLDSKIPENQLRSLTENFLSDMFGGRHPLLEDERARALLDVLVRKPGEKQLAKVFREYARLARQNPEGQGSLLGGALTPEQVFQQAIVSAGKRETAEAEAAKATKEPKIIKRRVGPEEAEPEPAPAPAGPTAEEQPGLWGLDARPDGLEELEKAGGKPPVHAGGPYIGPRGGKWADPQHTIPWDPAQHVQTSIFDFQPPPGTVSRADRVGKGPSPLQKALQEIEDQIRSQPVEQVHMLGDDGKALSKSLSGTRDNCRVMPEVLKSLREHGNATVTHNHPSGGFFSPEDIFLAVHWNLKEIRATTPDGGVFVLQRPEGGWGVPLEAEARGGKFEMLQGGKTQWTGDWLLGRVQKASSLAAARATERMDEKLEKLGGHPPGKDHPGFKQEEWNAITREEQLRAFQEGPGAEFGWKFAFHPGKAPHGGGGGAGRPGAGQDAPARVPAKWEGEQQGLLSAGKKSDPLAAPKVGDKLQVTYHPTIFGGEQAPVTYHVIAEKGDQVQLSQHPDSKHGPWMPKASVRQFVNDLAGKVEGPPSGNAEIDAVLKGKGKLLGKGDDGLAFKVGDKVVKVSTTVPYQPDNPGHRSPEGATDMLRQQVEVGNHLASLGIPGIMRSEFVAHAGKGFQIRDHVSIPEKLTATQLDKVQDTLLAMHKHGFALRDAVQVGLNAKGEPVLYDTGKAAPIEGAHTGIFSEVEGDMANLRRLYQDHGVDFVRKDKNEGEARWDFLRRQLLKPESPKAKARLKGKIDEALEMRRAHARATLKGSELESLLDDIKMDQEEADSTLGLGKSLEKGGPYIGPKGGLWEDPQHTRHWDPTEHQGKQMGLFSAKAPATGDSAQQVEAKQLPPDMRPERQEEVGGAPAGSAEPQPHPAGGKQDAAAEGAPGTPETWEVIGVEDLRPLDFWTGKRLAIPEHELRTCARCGRQHAVVVTMESNKGRSVQVGSGCGPAMAGGEKFFDSESQRKAAREAKKKQKAEHLRKVLAWLESESAALAGKHLSSVVYPGEEMAEVPSKQVDAKPGEMRKVLRTRDGMAEMWLPAGFNLEERRLSLRGAWAQQVVWQLMRKLQAKGSDWRWPAFWPTKAPGLDALHAMEDRLTWWLKKRLEGVGG